MMEVELRALAVATDIRDRLRTRSRRIRERRVIAATAVLALGAPLGAYAWVHARTGDLAGALGTAAGVPVRIGSVDADLTGAIRLGDVAVGDLFAADALEGSVAMTSLLAGELRADEIRVDGPRVALRVDADGDSDLARLARRLVRAGKGTGTGKRLRRIVVDRGTLAAHIIGIGELAADGVELVPDGDGIRLVTGRVRVHAGAPSFGVELSFARCAADLTSDMHLGRVLAVGGTGSLATATSMVVLRDLAAGRLLGQRPRTALDIRGAVDDAGIARSFAADLELAPGQLAIELSGERVPLRSFAAFVPAGIDVANAHATGRLAAKRGARTEVAIDATVDGLVVTHPAFAVAPVALSAGVHAELVASPEAITVARAGIDLGAIHLDAHGWMRRGAPLSGQVEVTLAPAPCADLMASVPEPIRGPLDGMALDGSFGGHLGLAVDLAAPAGEGVTLSHSLAGNCTVTAEPPGADVTALAQPGTQQLADGSHTRIGKGEASFAALRSLPAHLRGAFVAAEDSRFWDHDGFDVEQIARSLEIDLREHRLARGGSTISQQLVKNAFLTQRRSLDRKLQEAVLTWRLEARLSKREILERYLNIIELGPHVFGVEAAARHWFEISARELSVKQAAFLAALTSQPTAMSRRVRHAGALDPESEDRVQVVLRAMKRDGAIDADELDTALHAPLKFAASALDAQE